MQQNFHSAYTCAYVISGNDNPQSVVQFYIYTWNISINITRFPLLQLATRKRNKVISR